MYMYHMLYIVLMFFFFFFFVFYFFDSLAYCLDSVYSPASAPPPFSADLNSLSKFTY